MAWDDLRVLEAMARTRSAPAAARELGVSTSTIYRRLGALEEEIGAACVVRGSKPVELTAVGTELVKLARGLSTDLARVGSLVAEADEVIAGPVRMTTVEGFLPFLVEPLRELAVTHPSLRVDVHLSDTGPSVWRREADLALSVMSNPPEGLIGRKLAPIRYGVFGIRSACDQSPRRWIVTGPPRLHTPEAAWEREFAGDAAASAGSRNAMVAFAAGGLGVALLPCRLAKLHELHEVEEYREGLEALTRPVWLLTHPEVRSARVRTLSDALYGALWAEP